MNFNNIKSPISHGSGIYDRADLKFCGVDVVIEDGVLIFHAENISIGNQVYVGHQTMLKGYYKGEMIIGDGSWIGQSCFFHSAGNIFIGKAVGIGPFVKILTSVHQELNIDLPVLHQPLDFAPVVIHDGADIGIGSIILPGVTIGEGAIIGAGAVVAMDVEAYTVYAGVPAKFLRKRKQI